MILVGRLERPKAVLAFGVFRLILLFALTLLAPSVFSAPSEPDNEVTVQNTTLPETGTEYPDGASTPLRYLNAGKTQKYTIADAPLTPEQQAAFDRLTPQEQTAFQERRIGFLQRAVTILNLGRLTAGTGVYLKDKFLNIVTRGRHSAGVGTLGQRGHGVVQKILHSLNQQLFDHVDVIARSNEFGVTLTLGVAGGVGVGRYGLYEGAGIGISIGYNHQDKAAAFEFFVDRDTFSRAIPAVVGFRVGGKLYGYATHDSPETSGRYMRSRSSFLPGSLGVMDSPHAIQAGLNLHLGMGFVPAVLVEFMNDRLPLLKVTVSPVKKGMVVGSGAVVDLSKGVIHTVAHVTGGVLRETARVSGHAAVRCWAAMTGLFRR